MKSNARIYKITKIKGCKHGAKIHIKGRRPAAECQAEAEKAKADPVPFLIRRIPVKWEGGDMPVACKEREKGEGPLGLTGKGRAEIFQDAEKRMVEQLVAEAKKELKKREKNEEIEVLTTGHAKYNRIRWSLKEIIAGGVREEMIREFAQKQNIDPEHCFAANLSAQKVEERIEDALKRVKRAKRKRK